MKNAWANVDSNSELRRELAFDRTALALRAQSDIYLFSVQINGPPLKSFHQKLILIHPMSTSFFMAPVEQERPLVTEQF